MSLLSDTSLQKETEIKTRTHAQA